MNLFATVLTYPAPSANYRGESELNRSVIQKVTDGRFDYPIFSPESMRNALREILASYNLPCNRERLHDEDQLAVRFKDLPDPEKYIDDFIFGYLVAAGPADRKKHLKSIQEQRGAEAAKKFVFKRDSIFRMNMAKGLDPYRHNAVFTQSPLSTKESAYQNATTSALLHRETAVTAFQFPFALNENDCKSKREWTHALLKAIGELNGVAGNHARSYFEMAPASIIIRITKQLVAGFNTYCFRSESKIPDIVEDIVRGDCGYPGEEFYIGGEIIKRGLPKDKLDQLEEKRVTLDPDPRRLLLNAANKFLGAKA